MVIQAENIQELRSKIKNVKSPRIVAARDLAFNRVAMEQNLTDILLFPAITRQEDKVKYLDTGLNLIAAKIASKNNVTIALDLEVLRKIDKLDLGSELSRIAQNIKITSKAKTRLGFTNAISPESARALLRILGSTTQQAAQAISF